MKKILLNQLLEDEGGYVNHKDDNGGATKYGVTQAVAQSLLGKDAKDISWEDALYVADKHYWEPIQLDTVLAITGSKELVFKLLTISYNMGASRAGKFLQRVLNALSKDVIKVDGIVGNNTIGSLRAYWNHREDATTLLKYITGLQAAFYIELSEKDVKFKSFTYGWSKRI